MTVTDNIGVEKALAFIRLLPPRLGRFAGFDRDPETREAEITASLACADVRALAILDGEPAALAWVIRQGRGHCGITHFLAGNPAHAREAAKAFLHHAKSLGYASLAGFVPAPFRHIRDFAASLGFSESPRLKKAFLLPSRDRPHDGVMLIWNAEKEKENGPCPKPANFI